MPFVLIIAALAVGFAIVTSGRKTGQGFVNGQPVTLALGSIPGGTLREDAAVSWIALLDDASSVGFTFSPSGPRASFRTPEMQQSLIDEEGSYAGEGLAASVGKSPHQAGIALDVHWTSEEAHQWLLANCHSYGWHNRGDFFVKKEPWHYEFNPELYS